MKNEAESLLKIKNRIDEIKIEKAQLDGEIKRVRQELKEQFGTDDPDEIKVLIQKAESKKQKLEEQLLKDINKLKEKLF